MKYLKKFNESSTEDRFREDVHEYLAYLLDDDRFKCSVTTYTDFVIFSLKKYHSVGVDIIKWDEVKDKLIPFLYFISSEYNLMEYDYAPLKNPEGVFRKSTARPDGTGEVEHHFENKHCTVLFQRYIRNQYTSDWYYMNVEDVIEDSETIPEQFYQIAIKIHI